MYNGQGQIYSSEYKSFQWGILVNNSQFGLVHHFGLWRDRPEEVDDKVDGEEMVTGLSTADGMGMWRDSEWEAQQDVGYGYSWG